MSKERVPAAAESSRIVTANVNYNPAAYRTRRAKHRFHTCDPSNVLSGVFAASLCVANAGMWFMVSHVPVMSALWLMAAAICVKLQSWSRA